MKLVAHIVFTVVSDRVCIVATMPLKDGIFEDNRGSWICGLLNGQYTFINSTYIALIME